MSIIYFNPRSPYGERLLSAVSDICVSIFQSPLPLRGATLPFLMRSSGSLFQSTLPLRGATCFNAGHADGAPNFNPRSPYGERHTAGIQSVEPVDFNPRSPYGERLYTIGTKQNQKKFQSTLPLRERPRWSSGRVAMRIFQSTLPLRGATTRVWFWMMKKAEFNPRPPYGERLLVFGRNINGSIFQSTLPLRGATNPPIPALWLPQFQSTLPLRGATGEEYFLKFSQEISIHAPLTGSD